MGKLEVLKAHPRTRDNLKIIRNWEDVRIRELLTEKQKEQLKQPDQEHILLKDEEGKFELFTYRQIAKPANDSPDIKAFVFSRNGETWLCYWHIRGEAFLKIDVEKGKMRLFEEPGKEQNFEEYSNYSVVPVDNRRFMVFDLPVQKVAGLIQNAEVF
jgi:hypothetical protein